MTKVLKSGRVLLDDEAVKNLLEMEQELRNEGDFIQINSSKLASWIISRFKESAYLKEKESIKKEHFNHQKYLKEALKSVRSEDELRSALSLAIKKVSNKKRGRKKRELTDNLT